MGVRSIWCPAIVRASLRDQENDRVARQIEQIQRQLLHEVRLKASALRPVIIDEELAVVAETSATDLLDDTEFVDQTPETVCTVACSVIQLDLKRKLALLHVQLLTMPLSRQKMLC